MCSDNTQTIGFDLFMENPYWKSIYNNAPSEELKEYYQLMFEYKSFDSKDPLPPEVEERLKELWLTKEDLNYLIEKAGMPQAKIHYARCIQAIDNSPEDCCVAAISCTGEIRNPWYSPKPRKPED